MSAYVIVEFTVKDPDVYREKYAATLDRRPKSTEARFSPTVTGRSCTAMARSLQGRLVRFPDHETALRWYNSPEYQQLIDVRSVAMDARFSLLDGLPTPTEAERESA